MMNMKNNMMNVMNMMNMSNVTNIFKFNKKISLPQLERAPLDIQKNPEYEYLKIDGKNTLNPPDEYYNDMIQNFYESFQNEETVKLESTNDIINKFIEKIADKSEDIFDLSLNLSKQISKKTKIGKDAVEKSLKDLLILENGKKYEILGFNNSLTLGTYICKIIGTVLSYVYQKMNDYKIKDIQRLIEIRNEINKKQINIYNNFKRYCKDYRKDPNKEKMTEYFKENKNEYSCSPELIFLINKFSSINTVEINLDKINILSQDDVPFIELTILNLYILMPLKTMKINTLNSQFQEYLLKNYNKIFQKECKDIHEIMKKNYVKNPSNIYQTKWNFFNNLNLNDLREESKEISVDNKAALYSSDFTIIESNKELTKEEIVNNNSHILQIIMIILYSLNSAENNFNLELIANDCYNGEFITAFMNIYEMDWMVYDLNNFNLFDLLLFNNVMKTIQRLNIEINSLDFFSFEKLLNLLYHNNTLTSFNLSFFSSDIAYYPSFLYQLIFIYFNINILNKGGDPKDIYLFSDVQDIEEKIINKFFTFFRKDISVLFDIIKNKKNLEELGFNFDIPPNIQKNKKFMNLIFKFIMNALFLVSKRRIKKFCLLSPSTKIDYRINPDINYLLNNININNNIYLENLSLQLKFYKIEKIKNFISTRLKVLNIGDLDLTTLKILVNNICNYNFYKKSVLQKLSISILSEITRFNGDIKFIFENLFKIKMKNFVSLNIFTNIDINDKFQYLYLLKLLNNNWISEYRITFNKNSKNLLNENQNEIKKLEYLVPHNLEIKLIENIIIKENPDKDDDAYWYIKYLFNKVDKEHFADDERIKQMIFDILKYIYFVRNPKVFHTIDK